jgi:hypothetical protein
MVLADCLDAVGRHDEALAANEVAIENLSELFHQYPEAFDRRMESMTRAYLERCEKLGRSPDSRVLHEKVSKPAPL